MYAMGRKHEDYVEDIDFDSLEQHEYDDAEGATFYTCSLCGGSCASTVGTSGIDVASHSLRGVLLELVDTYI